MERFAHFIDGARLMGQGHEKQAVYNPATGLSLGDVIFAEESECRMAVESGIRAFKTWSMTTAISRAAIFFKFKQLLEDNIEKLALMVTEEQGKVLADARGSIQRGLELVNYLTSIPQILQGQFTHNVSQGIDVMTYRQPLGLCLGISPFNFPVMVPLWQALTAIAFGNTFILKPSEQDPGPCVFLADLLHQAGLPPGVFNVLHGGRTLVEHLCQLPEIQAVTAVASTPVAQSIYHLAQAAGKRVNTFGGAKNHCLIMPDFDPQQAADLILGAAFGAAGQRCMAISSVILVGDNSAEAFFEKLGEGIAHLRIGPGELAGQDMGPVISQTQLNRISDLIASGEKEGAQLRIDGRQHPIYQSGPGYFIGPTVFDHVPMTSRIYQAEIFGPVLCVLRADSLEEGIEMINANPYGNGVAILTHNGGAARFFAEKVEVGMVGVNVPIPVPIVSHPFGGWKQSVFGDLGMHGLESLRFYTKTKTVTSRWFLSEASLGQNLHMPVHH